MRISFLLLFSILSLCAAAQEDYTRYVDPMIGAGGLGRVFIGPSYPFGMAKPSPDCTEHNNSGWEAMPQQVNGFGQVHVSGTGGGPKYGNILIMPFVGAMDKISCPDFRIDENVSLCYYGTTFKNSGIKAEIMPSDGNPLVYAEKLVPSSDITVLVYGHYDVMPSEPNELWNTPPFTLTRKEDRVYGRGADDDKGQTMIQVKAFEYLVRHDLLTHNVKFILEGEEEIGSPSLAAFLKKHKELLSSDIILVSDTSMLSPELPSLTTGLRGLAYWEIEVTGPNRDLHSGHFGGAVANPILELCSLLDKVLDKDGRVTIPGFYDDVLELSKEEREMIQSIPFDEQKYKDAIGVQELKGEKGYVTIERNSCRPCFDVCGIWGGYTGEGSKTVLPSKAYAKVSCRLVPNQMHEKISQLFIDYMMAIAPKTISIKVTPKHGGEGYVCPITLPAYKAAEKGFEKAFCKRPLAVRRGGSISIIKDFEDILGTKTILMGFGLEQNAIHSPNESFSLDIFRKGIEAVVEFHKELDGCMKN